MLLCAGFTFHPLGTRVKEASVEVALNKATIARLQLESLDDDETTKTVRKKLRGEFKIGYEPAGVEGTRPLAPSARASERKTRAVWPLRENSQNKKGIHLEFVTVLIAQSPGLAADASGGLEVDLEIRAKLGPSIGNGLCSRHILARTTKRFDGKTLLGFRPATLDISKKSFSTT